MSQEEYKERLLKFRAQINEVDSSLTQLFEDRMKIIHDLAIFKMENSVSIYDPKREQEMREMHLAQLKDKSLRKYYEMFLNDILIISKEYQLEIRQKNKTGT